MKFQYSEKRWESGEVGSVRFLGRERKSGLARRGGPVFLQAAVGFVRKGHFEKPLGEERLDVALVIQVGIGETGGLEEVRLGSGFVRAGAEDGTDLLTRVIPGCRRGVADGDGKFPPVGGFAGEDFLKIGSRSGWVP